MMFNSEKGTKVSKAGMQAENRTTKEPKTGTDKNLKLWKSHFNHQQIYETRLFSWQVKTIHHTQVGIFQLVSIVTARKKKKPTNRKNLKTTEMNFLKFRLPTALKAGRGWRVGNWIKKSFWWKLNDFYLVLIKLIIFLRWWACTEFCGMALLVFGRRAAPKRALSRPRTRRLVRTRFECKACFQNGKSRKVVLTSGGRADN